MAGSVSRGDFGRPSCTVGSISEAAATALEKDSAQRKSNAGVHISCTKVARILGLSRADQRGLGGERRNLGHRRLTSQDRNEWSEFTHCGRMLVIFRILDLSEEGHRIQSSLVMRLFGPKNVASLFARCRRKALAAMRSLANKKLDRCGELAFVEPHRFLTRDPSDGRGALKSPTMKVMSRSGNESSDEPRMS